MAKYSYDRMNWMELLILDLVCNYFYKLCVSDLVVALDSVEQNLSEDRRKQSKILTFFIAFERNVENKNNLRFQSIRIEIHRYAQILTEANRYVAFQFVLSKFLCRTGSNSTWGLHTFSILTRRTSKPICWLTRYVKKMNSTSLENLWVYSFCKNCFFI